MIRKGFQPRVFTIQTTSIFLFFSAMQLTTWIPLRYWSVWGGGNFIDTWQVLNFANCYKEIGLDVYRIDVGDCSNYLYGRSLVQTMTFFNIGPELTQFVGYLFILVFAIVISSIFPVENKYDFVWLVVVLTSPPILLLVERGNFDILVLVGILLSTNFTRKKWEIAALLTIFIITLMKFYTAPLLILFILFGKSMKVRIIAVTLFIISILLISRDIQITESAYPHGASGQFGMKVWGEYLNLYDLTSGSDTRNTILSGAVFALFCLIAILIYRILPSKASFKLRDITILKKVTDKSQLFITTFICCYLAGMNFDYRLAILACAILAHVKTLEISKRQPYFLFLALCLWLSYPSGGLEPLGDLVLEIGLVFFIIYTVFSWSKPVEKK